MDLRYVYGRVINQFLGHSIEIGNTWIYCKCTHACTRTSACTCTRTSACACTRTSVCTCCTQLLMLTTLGFQPCDHIIIFHYNYHDSFLLVDHALRCISSLHFTTQLLILKECWSACVFKNTLFLGTQFGVWSLDVPGEDTHYPGFSVEECVRCARVHGKFLYLLKIKNEECHIEKINLSVPHCLFLVRSWAHPDSVKLPNQLTIRNNVVYIPNRSKSSITQYTLGGFHIKPDIPVKLGKTSTYLCTTSGGQLIVSQTSPPLLACVDPKTHQELWRMSDLVCPQAVVVDKQTDCILVYTEDIKSKTAFLDMRRPDTGKFKKIYASPASVHAHQ